MDKVDEEIKKMKSDIERSGFPLEILISSILIKNGWNVVNQQYYFDDAEKKSRTIDIVSHKAEFRTIGDYDRVKFSLVLDCKKSTTPWVFYTMHNEPDEQLLYSIGLIKIISNPDARKSPVFIKWLKKQCHYSFDKTKEFAVNYYEPFKKGGGNAIPTAFYQVTKACNFELNFVRTSILKIPMKPLFVYYPVVVFDGHLYECKPEGEEINICRRNHFCYHFSQERNYIIDIVEKDYFEDFLKSLDTEISCLKDALENDKPNH